MRSQLIFVGVLMLLGTASIAGAGVIDTFTGNTISGANPFGELGNTTFGQTFTVTTPATILDEFSFWAGENANSPQALSFKGYVMAWTGTTVSGPLLYESAAASTSLAAPGIEKFTFATGGLDLTPGSEYVAFLSTASLFDGINDQGVVGWTGVDAYSGGSAVFATVSSFSYTTFGLAGSHQRAFWPTSFGATDLAFQATFSSPAAQETVPEPSSLALLGLGSISMVVGAARRRREAATVS